MRSNGYRGFTLIELVVVVAILAILASFAIPRFRSLKVEARAASRDAVAGSVRSGAALSHTLWLAQGQPASVAMDGRSIRMVNGYPARDSIDDTVGDIEGFGYSSETGVFVRVGAPATCTVTYTEAASPDTTPAIATGGAC
jgi:MSHA pilin protein MshA